MKSKSGLDYSDGILSNEFLGLKLAVDRYKAAHNLP
jgi:hypothetical protein